VFSFLAQIAKTLKGMQSCERAADITPAARKRLLTDLKRLHEEPIPCAAAQPCSDQDITLWDGVIGVEMDVTHIGCVTVPLHFLIDFPFDYPQSAPNIGSRSILSTVEVHSTSCLMGG
jgi:ubiquitin-protein ligase